MVPIGYRAEARTLTLVDDEAALVRRIFARYLALGSVNRLKAELDAAGIRTPERLHRNGRRSGGAAFSRGKLYGMLANPLFIGRIRHRDLVHPGQHAAIVDRASGRRCSIGSAPPLRGSRGESHWTVSIFRIPRTMRRFAMRSSTRSYKTRPRSKPRKGSAGCRPMSGGPGTSCWSRRARSRHRFDDVQAGLNNEFVLKAQEAPQ